MEPLCTWTLDEFDGSWGTSCNKAFVMDDGTPYENDMLYCAFCGRHIEQVIPAQEDEDDDE